jgi:hypothetical protein
LSWRWIGAERLAKEKAIGAVTASLGLSYGAERIRYHRRAGE